LGRAILPHRTGPFWPNIALKLYLPINTRSEALEPHFRGQKRNQESQKASEPPLRVFAPAEDTDAGEQSFRVCLNHVAHTKESIAACCDGAGIPLYLGLQPVNGSCDLQQLNVLRKKGEFAHTAGLDETSLTFDLVRNRHFQYHRDSHNSFSRKKHGVTALDGPLYKTRGLGNG
jgi:hypothetical protein